MPVVPEKWMIYLLLSSEDKMEVRNDLEKVINDL